MRPLAFVFLLLLSAGTISVAAEFHVASGGNDANPGTALKPFATITRARDAVRGQAGSTVYLHGGTYAMEETLVLTPADSGVTYRAFGNEKPVLSGGQRITGWQKEAGNLWSAVVPKGWRFHYLYVDGKRAQRSRHINHDRWRQWPKDHKPGKPDKKGQLVTFTKNQAALAGLPSNGDVEMVCIMFQYGVMGNGVLTDINPAAGTARWNSLQTNIRESRNPAERGYNLENAPKFIDQPGEWAVDSAAGKAYYRPRPGEDMTRATVIAPRLYELIRLQGDRDRQWVHDVVFSGLTLVYTDRLPETEWPRDWVKRQWEHPDAAIFIEGARACAVTDCRIVDVGASGVTLHQFAQQIRIEGNEIGWTGSDGVLLCGYGPGTLDVNRDNQVVRNWIHDVGLGNYWHSACIQNYQSGHNRVALNLLERSAYNGISIVGVHPNSTRGSNPEMFFEGTFDGQFELWNWHNIRWQDFPRTIQEGIRTRKFVFDRETLKPYLHSNANVYENNIVVQPEQLLDEGGAIYAYGCGKGNIWRENLVFKSSGMPGSSILALDDIAEYFTITGNVIWVNGQARAGTIGMRPTERGNVIKDNIRAVFRPEHADPQSSGNVSGLTKGFYRTDPTREPVYRLLKTITEKVNAAGGWLGNPTPAIPAANETVQQAVERALPKGSHLTIE